MKKLRLAISTQDIEATIEDYTIRLNAEPCLVLVNMFSGAWIL